MAGEEQEEEGLEQVGTEEDEEIVMEMLTVGQMAQLEMLDAVR